MEDVARLTLPFDEFRVWETHLKPRCCSAGVDQEGLDILAYVCTEMLNNVLDHSGSAEVWLRFAASPNDVFIHIEDHGTGVFKRVADALALETIPDAMIELSKGKTTSDPAHHTGQGLFFSARACDWFAIEANGYALSWENGEGPELLKFTAPARRVGTLVALRLSNHPRRTLRAVFDAYCPQPELDFSRTTIALRLVFETQGGLVSRSQAKRVVHGLERFAEITFDFDQVPDMQQGYADEIFRVWRNAHPQLQVKVIHAGERCAWMLAHVGFRP